jgi:enoyl-CoA hydratase
VEHQGRVAVITLQRPDRLNAIGTEMVVSLSEVLSSLAVDDGVGALVVTGSGRAFSAGADIVEFSSLAGPSQFAAFIHRLTDALDQLQDLPKPSIAAINGIAFGGGMELALACDLRVAATEARLGLPEIKLGLLPGGGGTARVSRLLPPAIAKQLLLTGEPLGAADALRLGLVNQVVDDALEGALTLASRLASLPPLALAAAKRLVDHGRELSLDAAIVFERETVSGLFGTEDRAEGVAAFLEKRAASFKGR